MSNNNTIIHPSSMAPTSSSSSWCEYKTVKLLGFAISMGYLMFLISGGEEEMVRYATTSSSSSSSSDVYFGSSSSSSRDDSSSFFLRNAFPYRASNGDDVVEDNAEKSDSRGNMNKKKEKSNSNRIKSNETDSNNNNNNNNISKKVLNGNDQGKNVAKSSGKESEEPIKSIILLGERHSGTNWITDHLTDCFQQDVEVKVEYTRFKHWFQSDDDTTTVPDNSAVVVSMFRDPYDWVEAMRERPHHAHDHFDLQWRDFVTKPWMGTRGKTDLELLKHPNQKKQATCMDYYSFVDVVPCSKEDSPLVKGFGNYKYELNHDGSEKAYSSIIDLRREKILNHLSVANFRGTRAFFPYRYEDLNVNGTHSLLRDVEKASGLKAKCDPVEGTGVIKHKEVPKEYVDWMNKYVNWNVESKIGYTKRLAMFNGEYE